MVWIMHRRTFIRLAGLLCVLVIITACGSNQHNVHNNHQQEEQEPTEAHVAVTKAIWHISEELLPDQESELKINIVDQQDQILTEFELNHEKKLHLIVVSKDLSYFDHLHPKYDGKGTFRITLKLPSDGEYKLIADYLPVNMKQQTQSHWIKVGDQAVAAQPIDVDHHLSKAVNGLRVTLETEQLNAGSNTNIMFRIADKTSGRPIRDLEPYLGAVGHLVILSADTELYIHNHPVDEDSTGPEAVFNTTFPQAGIYKLWGQFQYEGKVITVPFVVEVKGAF
jgi:hypothetical protein